MRDHWSLDPDVVFLNHGSFGACPRAVLDEQARLRARMEAEPVRFFVRELEALYDDARAVLGAFLGADPDDLAFVANATAGVNTVVRSLRWQAGDELVTTDHAYNACNNALAFAAERAGARVVVARVPFPVGSGNEIAQAVLEAVGPRTRLVMIDHVTSPTGLVFPVATIVRHLGERGIDVLVDGAHAPGMVEVDLNAIGAAYYTGNCHKWLCAPKGAGFLHVRKDRQAAIHPLVISHGANSPRRDRTRFRLEFDWTGTHDPTAALAVPAALAFLAGLVPGGWPALRARNRALVLDGRRQLVAALGVALPCPDDLIGSLASLPLPDGTTAAASPLYGDPLQDALFARFRIEVPVVPWPAPPRRLVRISAQLYNTADDYARLGAALRGMLGS